MSTDLVTNNPEQQAQGLAHELGEIMSARVVGIVKTYQEQRVERAAQSQSILSSLFSMFIALIFLLMIVMHPDKIMSLIQSIVDLGESTGKSASSAHVTIPTYVYFVLLGAAAVLSPLMIYWYKRTQRLLKLTWMADEYEDRRKALLEASREMVDESVWPETEKAITELFAMHENVSKNPEKLAQYRPFLSGVFGHLLVAGHLTREINNYKDSRQTVQELRPENTAQKDINESLDRGQTKLKDNIVLVSEQISQLELEKIDTKMLSMTSQELAHKTAKLQTQIQS